MDAAKPHVARVLEALAAILGLDEGRQRLEVVFDRGRLESWQTHAERRPVEELARFNERAAWLVDARVRGRLLAKLEER